MDRFPNGINREHLPKVSPLCNKRKRKYLKSRLGIATNATPSRGRDGEAMQIISAISTALTLAVGLTTATASAAGRVDLLYTAGGPQVEFAVGEIRAALSSRGDSAVSASLGELYGFGASSRPQTIRLVIASSADESRRVVETLALKPLIPNESVQAYSIRRLDTTGRITYAVLATGAVGAMYGSLDLAEAIRLGTLSGLHDGDHTPFIANRGIKFNIPLDARTPSYSDAGDSAQQNIPEVWDIAFWHELLDELARQRYNVLSLWNLHPFPSMVRVPEYPDVALADVMRTTDKFDSSYDLTGRDMVRPSLLAHLQVVKKMTIEQKIQFWRAVMDYAHDRGIDVYLFTWNIFTWGTDGKYGITSAQDNPTTIDYFRKSVAATLLTYPRLAGIGITAGESMENLKGEFSKEKWLANTYGKAIEDVKKVQPDRTVLLVHRMNQAILKDILPEWKDYPGTFELSYKYSVAHMYSLTNPPFAKRDLVDMPAGMRTWMTVRNDDIYSFRWGDPEFARAYLRGMPGPDVLAGFNMGPDGYTWGREFISTEPDTPRQLVIKKQWYSFMLWGRLSYEPSLPDSLFQRTLAVRYPTAPADKLFAAYQASSKIIPEINRFFWAGGGNDLAWFPEACLSHPKHHGFYTVEDFVKGATTPGSGMLSIHEYTDAIVKGSPITGTTPPQVAEQLRTDASHALALLDAMPGAGSDKELRLTLGDLHAMSYLGTYYADKIMGATELAGFQATGQSERRSAAVQYLTAATEDWKRYTATATRQYRPQLLTRVGYVDLNALTEKVEDDVRLARIDENTGR
jgi:hypothetical protein